MKSTKQKSKTKELCQIGHRLSTTVQKQAIEKWKLIFNLSCKIKIDITYILLLVLLLLLLFLAAASAIRILLLKSSYIFKYFNIKREE